jgi:lipoprotein-anchoring transpeptidase ErfK/SrfK
LTARGFGVAVAVPGLVAIGLLAGSLLASGGGFATPVHGPLEAQVRASGGRLVSGGASRHGRRTGSVVANAAGRQVLVYRRPGAAHPWRRYSNPTSQRTPLVFLVRAHRGSWLRVMLPSRPNGSEGWVQQDTVELRSDPYSVLIDLSRRRLAIRDAGRLLLSTRVGVGRAATPTPSGLYYLAELLRQPEPRGIYGPWAFALSAHSSVLSHFGGGDGQVGIHGTNDPAGVGHTVSHGCIRVRNRVIERLAAILPLGTPVRILAASRPSSRERNTPVSGS